MKCQRCPREGEEVRRWLRTRANAAAARPLSDILPPTPFAVDVVVLCTNCAAVDEDVVTEAA